MVTVRNSRATAVLKGSSKWPLEAQTSLIVQQKKGDKVNGEKKDTLCLRVFPDWQYDDPPLVATRGTAAKNPIVSPKTFLPYALTERLHGNEWATILESGGLVAATRISLAGDVISNSHHIPTVLRLN